MQLIVRGEQTHVLDVAPTANVEALRAQLSLLEAGLFPLDLISPMQTEAFVQFWIVDCGCVWWLTLFSQGVDAEQLNLFCSGAPLEVSLIMLISSCYI